MINFKDYGDIVFGAFLLHSKRKDIVDRKHEILVKVSEHYNTGADSILFIGFNPAILASTATEIFVSEVSDNVLSWLQEQNPYIKLYNYATQRKFDTVVAFDEYLTFAPSEEEQKQMINALCKIANNLVVTTVKDYKNQEFKDREYSQPAIIKDGNHLTAYTEIHDWSHTDKNAWTTSVYELAGSNSKFHGVYSRRTLYFKQLAKFSLDSGADTFLVHKNLMYKSLIKKNYEHVISIYFENE